MISKKLQSVYLGVYKVLGFGFLTSMVLGISVYAFSLAFYTLSDTWAAPLVLSPAQERVLSYQPQIANMMAALEKQKVDLTTAASTVSVLTEQVRELRTLSNRIEHAAASESADLTKTSRDLSSLLAIKGVDIKQTEVAVSDARRLLKQVDDELAAKLITSDQAAQRRIALQASLNAATDARTQAVQLEQQIKQLVQGAGTLRGGATSLQAASSVKQIVELRAMAAQLDVQIATAKATADALQKAIVESDRVLTTAKQSPYYLALREPVTVAFMPYENLQAVHPGDAVYDCALRLVWCRKVGTVETVYNSEEYARHPLFKTDLKGRFVGVKFTDPEASRSQVVFIGGKPLFI